MPTADTSTIKVHGCAGALSSRSAPARSRAHPGSGVAIDLHCHTFSDAIEALVADHPEKVKELQRLSESVGAASLEINNRQWAKLMPRMTSLDVRLEEMDRMGVDIQVISPNPTQYYYWAEPDVATVIVSTYNDYIAEACAAAPEIRPGARPEAIMQATELIIENRILWVVLLFSVTPAHRASSNTASR